LNHYATPEFWYNYRALSIQIQQIADRAFDHMNSDPRHPGLHLKQVDEFWTARVGLHHRAVGVTVSDGVSWFWIGTHAEYDKLLGR